MAQMDGDLLANGWTQAGPRYRIAANTRISDNMPGSQFSSSRASVINHSRGKLLKWAKPFEILILCRHIYISTRAPPGQAVLRLESLHLFDFSQKGATQSRDLGKIIRCCWIWLIIYTVCSCWHIVLFIWDIWDLDSHNNNNAKV